MIRHFDLLLLQLRGFLQPVHSIDMIKNGESGGQAKLTRAVTVFLFNAALCSAAAVQLSGLRQSSIFYNLRAML